MEEHTPFILPARIDSIGRSWKNSPSTTGTKVKTPKRSLALRLKFTVTRVFASVFWRQVNLSAAEEHLKHHQNPRIKTGAIVSPSLADDGFIEPLRRMSRTS